MKRVTMALYVYITGFYFMYKNKNWPLLDFYIHSFSLKGHSLGSGTPLNTAVGC